MKVRKFKYFIIISIIILFASCVKGEKQRDKEIIWKYGVAVIDGQPSYIDSDKLDQSVMFYDKNYIKNIKGETIEAGKLVWGKKFFYSYSTKKIDPYAMLLETKKTFFYKIENNNLYVSLDKNEWDKLVITIVEENPSKPKNEPVNFNPPIFMIIHLKCKWFEGQYELVGTTG